MHLDDWRFRPQLLLLWVFSFLLSVWQITCLRTAVQPALQQVGIHLLWSTKEFPQISSSHLLWYGVEVWALLPPTADASPGLEVSLTLDGVPSLVDGIAVCVLVRNGSTSPRFLVEHLNAQLKKYNGVAQDCFWKTQQNVHIEAGGGEDLSL